MYIVKAIQPSSEYEGIIYTQSVLLENKEKNTVWIEDNDMKLKDSDVGKTLNLSNYLQAHINCVYMEINEIPENKKHYTYECLFVDDKHIILDGFIYKTSEKISKGSNNNIIWASIFMKDLK
jgi:hypothetical protein